MPLETEGEPRYAALVTEQLKCLGHDLTANGLVETPNRVARFHREHLGARGDAVIEAAGELKPFEAPEDTGLVAIRVTFSSMCEHHIMPFEGYLQVVYQPQQVVTGLSKISRAARVICMRPQMQERIGAQLADAVMAALAPVGVLVDVVGTHTCMTCRGIRDPQSRTRTRTVRGLFQTDRDLRDQAISMLL